MQVKPSRVTRTTWALILNPLISRALRRDLPVPERMHAIELLRHHIDHLLSREWFRSEFNRERKAVVSFLRSLGYDVSEPRGDPVEWFRSESRCREGGELLLDCLDRVANLMARILAIAAYIVPADEFDQDIMW